MAQPITIFNQVVINNANLGVSQTSEIISIRDLKRGGLQAIWTGGTGTAGTVIYEITNEDPQLVSNPTFTQVNSSTVSTTSGSAARSLSSEFSYLRIRWNRTAGTGGTITILVCGRYY